MSPSPPRRGAYGFDAPYAPLLMALGGTCLLALCLWRLWDSEGLPSTRDRIAVLAPGFAALWLFLNAGTYTYTTRAGKFAVWAELLDRLDLKGDERLLDIGCGRGAVLLMAAQRLPRGRSVGVDVWSATDQSGNAEEVTRRNATLEGVAERVELHTADMRRLPFDDGLFDVVVSSLAIHNVPGAGQRAKALREAARVLKPGGKLAIADIRHTSAYARELEACGLKITERRSLGYRFWYGAGPWAATRLVAAIKPEKPPPCERHRAVRALHYVDNVARGVSMPRYRLFLPIRSVSYYRLPDTGATAEQIIVTPGPEPTYTAQVDTIAPNADVGYRQAAQHAEHLLGYLALLGEAAGFILDGRNGLRARNLDIQENPVPADAPPPPFEAIGGVIFAAGQEAIAAEIDPDGSKRREGLILVFNTQPTITPQAARVADLCSLFEHREAVPDRVRIAIGILHDAACAREPASSFAQTFTALEVLTEHLRPANLLEAFYQKASTDAVLMDALPNKTRASLLDALREFFASAQIPGPQADRMVGQVANTHSVSQVDIFRDYLGSLGISVERAVVSNWRTIRGALVHAAAGAQQLEAMRDFRDVVRRAVMEELRRAAAAD